MQTIMDEDKIREVFKEVLVEMFEKKKNVFHDIVIEAMEEVALSHAIKEGERSGLVTIG